MKKNMMRRNLRQSIFKSIGRYLAIVAIIALGAGIFVGLNATRMDMIATGQKFTDEQNMFDLRLMSTYGWDRSDVGKVADLDGVVDAEGMVSLDAIVRVSGTSSGDMVYRFFSLPEKVNQVALRGGRMPLAADECLVDGFQYDDSVIGATVTLTEENEEDVLESFTYRTYKVVGYVATPLYMDMNRGSTSVGNGSLSSYLYIPMEGFDVDYYTEIDITLPGDYEIYTDAYDSALESASEELEPKLEPLAEKRFTRVLADAREQYAEGEAEYEKGRKEFEDGIAEAEQELDNAYRQLSAAQQELNANEALINDGFAQIREAKDTLTKSEQELEKGKAELQQQKTDTYAQLDAAQAELEANAPTVESSLLQVNGSLVLIEPGILLLNASISEMENTISWSDSQITQLEQSKPQLQAAIQQTQGAISSAQTAPIPDLQLLGQLYAQLAQQQIQRDAVDPQIAALKAQKELLKPQLEALKAQKAQQEPQYQQLLSAKATLEEAKAAIDAGFAEVAANRALADQQFAAAEQEIADAEAQIEEGRTQLAEKEEELQNGSAQLAVGRVQLNNSWTEYNEGVRELEDARLEGEAELQDAAAKLADAREKLDGMDEAEIFVLDRNTNVGFASLESNADIVAGVSRVFPVFFLLIASLVCITTMTRMVSEERTQIGTLKALGYSNAAIIGKYLAYAGSGAVVGCGLGVLLGSVVFPNILWAAYCIMLYITPNVVIQFNWLLCLIVVLTYTVVILAVTWYSCHKALEEVPAELIRPKAPTSGKKIFLEHFRFWEKISFLNKVTIRNIFRYRQRLAMMLVGIGGCTALLVTGFGLRDSIVNIVDYQFEEVTQYDMEVYFAEAQTAEQQKDFISKISGDTRDVVFFHQTSVELDFDKQVREIGLITGGDRIADFIDLHSGDTPLNLPGPGEAVLTVGVAEAMGIKVGDQVTLRDSDMRQLHLTVSAIYDNNISNYAIVRPETVASQWGETPQEQMAYVKVAEDLDHHEIGAKIARMSGVLNVSVSEDTASLVGSMMDALDLVVVTIVICAGLLAVIVLYNLTNININERIREIATIKVLGFNASETAAYVFKENLALTVMGMIVGLPLGKLLLKFVMSQVKIDFCWFQARVTPLSYLLAMVLTLLSAVLVNLIFHFKLDKINMAEALKSVE